jgi:hypothetical protein
MPDNVEEQLAIYVDERGLSEMTKEVQTVSSFQDCSTHIRFRFRKTKRDGSSG